MKDTTKKTLQNIAVWYCFALIGFSAHYLVDKISQPKLLAQPQYDSECQGLDLESTSFCLEQNLMEFYKFNITNMGKRLSFEELKEYGGVCAHYADWYIYQLKQRGFNAREFVFPLNDTVSHKVAVVSDDYSYCVLDQSNIGCVKLQGGDDAKPI